MNVFGRWLSMLVVAGLLAAPSVAQAQGDTDSDTGAVPEAPDYGNNQVKAQFVGVSGGAIAGFELVAAAEALFKVKKAWPYLTFPFLGAAGGGVGGYFLEKASPQGAVALLVASLVLVIPTAVLVSVSRAYDPSSENAVEDENAGARYSFEASPTRAAPADDATSTEVEASPDSPDGELPPPGEVETPGAGETPPADGGPGASARLEQGQVRAAQAGALLYFDSRSGFATMSMPAVALLSRDSGPSLFGQQSHGAALEVMVPLLHIDLP